MDTASDARYIGCNIVIGQYSLFYHIGEYVIYFNISILANSLSVMGHNRNMNIDIGQRFHADASLDTAVAQYVLLFSYVSMKQV